MQVTAPGEEGADASSGFGVERPSQTRTQHALRIPMLLDRTGEDAADGDPPAAVKAVRSELRLQTMDFWMRNRDYLADEIVSQVEEGKRPDSCLQVAQGLLEDAEPDRHYYPMSRWFYGAYEAIDDAMALLETYGLATFWRSGEPGTKRSLYSSSRRHYQQQRHRDRPLQRLQTTWSTPFHATNHATRTHRHALVRLDHVALGAESCRIGSANAVTDVTISAKVVG